jgi:phage terminase large subunit-like protein
MGVLTEHDRAALAYDWKFWARPNQLPPPGDWRVWLLLAGRGFGKSRTGAEWVKDQVDAGKCARVALVAPTAADARDVMVEGESGLLSVCPPWNHPTYNSSLRRVTWPNGAIATLYSADEPERLRGPQHDGAWVDELGSWRYPEAWDMLMFGLRLGNDPRVVVTTTPRPIPIIKQLVADKHCTVTRGSTYDNLLNLAPDFVRQIVARYEGTRLGRQELMAEILEDVPGALWTLPGIEALRVPQAPELVRVVVAIDPAATNTEDSDETGIVVAGRGRDGQGYVLADLSLKASPDGWGRRAATAYQEFAADRVVYEANQGGDMVKFTLRTVDPRLPLRDVHASRGKRTRAEPIAALYEQGRIHHVGIHRKLEDQMCSWNPDDARMDSPDRVDALVWALTDLMLDRTGAVLAQPGYMAGKPPADDADEPDHEGAVIHTGRDSFIPKRRGSVPSGW